MRPSWEPRDPSRCDIQDHRAGLMEVVLLSLQTKAGVHPANRYSHIVPEEPKHEV